MESISFEVRVAEALLSSPKDGSPACTLQRHDRDDGGERRRKRRAVIQSFFATLLLESDRPVLMVPPQFKSQRAAKHIVAWRPTRDATRSLLEHSTVPVLFSH